MQAPRGNTIRAVSIAHEVFEMEDDPLQVFGIASKCVQGFGVAAFFKGRPLDLRWKAINMLRVVTVVGA